MQATFSTYPAYLVIRYLGIGYGWWMGDEWKSAKRGNRHSDRFSECIQSTTMLDDVCDVVRL